MSTAIVDRIKVIDTDTHIAEPPDLWTSRVAKKWGDLVPHVKKLRDIKTSGTVFPGSEFLYRDDDDVWVFGDNVGLPIGFLAWAGYKDRFPNHPTNLAEAHPAASNARERLKVMDDVGVYAATLFPNLGGHRQFQMLNEPELALACCRAYNDFLHDWCSEDPKRLIPLVTIPMWDVQAATAEIRRTAKLGHRGIVFGQHSESYGLPWLADPHWNPIWETAQELGLPICFHIEGGGAQARWPGADPGLALAKATVMGFLDNASAISEVIIMGMCDRFPRLNFVSVESGTGFIPYLLESMDWQWTNLGLEEKFPERKMLPSEYFRRQVYATFWFERDSITHTVELVQDNVFYETDFPHPTSISPGPHYFSTSAREALETNLSALPESVLRKVLHDNAARVYHID
jgi:predicted TIM-barrel fold metal-dependent hydrolase